MTDSYAIETRGLSRTFGRQTAVDGLNLLVPRGCIYGFLGPNGAGKTTTIRLLLGLLRPTNGNIRLMGEPIIYGQPNLRSSVGALAETPTLYPHLTGAENLEVTRRMLGLPKTHVAEALEMVGLTADARRLVHSYSLGMRQRLGLALACLAKPSLLILDEPGNGLDPAGTRELRTLLRRFVHEQDATVFLSSHVLSEVEQIADRIGIIHRARLLFQGRLDELKGYERKLRIRVDQCEKTREILKTEGWRISESSEGWISVRISSDTDAVVVNKILVEKGIQVLALQPQQATLEDLFIHLTSPSDKGTAA